MLFAWILFCLCAAGSGCYPDLDNQVIVGHPRRRNYYGEENSISNIDLLLPLMIRDHEKQQGREIHYSNVDGRDFDLEYNRHKPADYITNNPAITLDSLEDQTVYIREDKKIKSVKKELKNENTKDVKYLKKQKEEAPKAVPLKLLKVCDRLLKQTNLKSHDIKIEVAIHYCTELLDTLFDKDGVKDVSTANKEEVIEFKANSNEDSSNECTRCLRYIFGNLKDIKDEDRFLNKKRPFSHSRPVGPLGWFGPYNGRRDWMVLNENYPGILLCYNSIRIIRAATNFAYSEDDRFFRLRSYLHKYKKKILD